MSEIVINSSSIGSQLMNVLQAGEIEPGTDVGYNLCKMLWEYHPLGGKLVEKPVRLALSKPRIITIDKQPKEMLIEAFEKEWEKLGATAHIRDTMFLKRTYGASAIVYGADKIPTTDPIDPWDLPHLNLYFNQLDPLNLAGSIVTNQNPNAPDFQKPLTYTTAAGQPYHPSRSVVVFNGTPIYLSFQSSAFGFTGRSVFQRALYPLKSFIQSMVTDDLVTFKAGLLISKQKPAGSIVNKMMESVAGIKRSYLQQGVTGNVLSIDIDESIEAINLQNTDTAMTTARDNIIANIAAASDVPALLLKDEAFTQGFGEGSEDAKAIVQYVNGIREEMHSLYAFFDKIVMHRAWNEEFYESVKAAYPDVYANKSYKQAFYEWKNSFKPEWESLIEEPESERVKVEETKLKGITEVLRTILPVVDPQNRALAIQWAQDNLNEMPDLFQSTLTLDADLISEYEPPEAAMPEEKMPRGDAMMSRFDSYNDADFVESDHPRGHDGQFISAGGGSASQSGKPTAAMYAQSTAKPHNIPKTLPAKKEKFYERHLEDSLHEKDIQRLPKDKREQFKQMYETAAMNKDFFDKSNAEIAKELGGKAAVVTLKGSERAVDKITKSYNNDPSKIKDLLRTTISIKSTKDVNKTITKLVAKFGEPEKHRDLLDNSKDSLGGSGYRDVNMVFKVNGSYAEVQINLPQMLKAKDKCHKYYEIVRKVVEDAESENRDLTKEESMQVDFYNAKQKEIYEAAWQDILKNHS